MTHGSDMTYTLVILYFLFQNMLRLVTETVKRIKMEVFCYMITSYHEACSVNDTRVMQEDDYI
jgi:hypothetical protein